MKNTAKRSAASRKAWRTRTRKQMQAARVTPLQEGKMRKGGINPPPQNFIRPDPPPPFTPNRYRRALPNPWMQ